MHLDVLPGPYAIAKLPADADVPSWAAGEFVSITRTREELSIVCGHVPDSVECQRGWRCTKVRGPLDFSLVGVLAALAAPLAQAGVPVFVVSTFDTDYVLVPDSKLDRAIESLRAAGNSVEPVA